mmetsp:Transcript_26181/g.75510  ORF Transcript_26181/g.75510 Transcript_26181/m.75510 type:complete len:250 (-) Transcript_26181:299-1048(-)
MSLSHVGLHEQAHGIRVRWNKRLVSRYVQPVADNKCSVRLAAREDPNVARAHQAQHLRPREPKLLLLGEWQMKDTAFADLVGDRQALLPWPDGEELEAAPISPNVGPKTLVHMQTRTGTTVADEDAALRTLPQGHPSGQWGEIVHIDAGGCLDPLTAHDWVSDLVQPSKLGYVKGCGRRQSRIFLRLQQLRELTKGLFLPALFDLLLLSLIAIVPQPRPEPLLLLFAQRSQETTHCGAGLASSLSALLT